MSSISFVSPLTGAPLFPKLPLPSFPPGCRGSALIEGKASWPSSAAAPPPPQDPKPHAPAPLSITVPEELLHSFSSPLAAALLSFAGAPPKEKAALPAGVYVGHFDEACRYFGVPVAVESECATAEDAPLADVQDAANYLSAVESVGKSVEWWKGLGDADPRGDGDISYKHMCTIESSGICDIAYDYRSMGKGAAAHWMSEPAFRKRFDDAVELEGFVTAWSVAKLVVGEEWEEYADRAVPRRKFRTIVTVAMVSRKERMRRAAEREGGGEAKKQKGVEGV